MTKNTLFKANATKNVAIAHHEEFAESLELLRIKEKNEQISLRYRLRPLRKFIGIALILLLLWSATTESFFLLSGFFGLTQNWWLSGAISLLLLVLIEGGKYFLGAYVVRFVAQGWLRDGALYVISFLVLLPVAIAVFWGSWFMSVEGSPYVSKFLQQLSNTSVSLISTDSIHQQFQAERDSIKPILQTAQNMTWNGKVTRKGAQLALSVQYQINALEARRDTALAIAHRKNEALLQQAKQDRTDWSGWLSGFGGIGEALTVLFLIFIEFYDRASYLELPNGKPTPPEDNASPTPQNNNSNTVPHDAQNANTLADANAISNKDEGHKIKIENTPKQPVEQGLQIENTDKSIEENMPLPNNETHLETSVEQSFQAETEDNEEHIHSVDVRYFKQRVKQCYLRSLTQQSEAGRMRNKERMEFFMQELGKLGIRTIFNDKDPYDVLFLENNNPKQQEAAA